MVKQTSKREERVISMLDPVMNICAARLEALSRERGRHGAGERGDVPGWVLITVMTAGLVAALWAIAGPQLAQMLSDALSSVRG